VVCLAAVLGGFLGALASRHGAPLATTSVNFSGHPENGGTQPAFAMAQVADFLVHDVRRLVRVVIDGGVCPLVDALTVVDCSGDLRYVCRTRLLTAFQPFASCTPPAHDAGRRQPRFQKLSRSRRSGARTTSCAWTQSFMLHLSISAISVAVSREPP
jgi:hypothetical protein